MWSNIVMGSIPVGDSDISLSYVRVMLVNSSFTLSCVFDISL